MGNTAHFQAIGFLFTCVLSYSHALRHIDSDSIDPAVQLDLVSSFFDSSRIFQAAPSEGITLVSGSDQNAFLINGDTDDVVSSFVFMPPAGATLDQYDITYACDSPTIVISDFCSVTNAVAEILDSPATAYNTTVTCSFSLFPGTTSCRLKATPLSSFRSFNDAESNRSSSSMPRSKLLRQVDLPSYESPKITVNVYGVVFYLPGEADGEISENAAVVSGNSNSYQLDNYDRNDQGVREIYIAANVPGTGVVTGTTALSYFEDATVAAIVDDHILWYDTLSCQLTDASISNGIVSLPSGGTCGIGIAAEDSGSPRMGVQFRTYKSGKYTINMAWPTFGTSLEAYEQTIIFDISEPAPPVVVRIQKEDIYKSVPCGAEQLTLTAYNVRYADTRTITTKATDDTITLWSEVVSSFSYDSSIDQSTIVFDSAGGLGRNVPFTLIAMFGTDKRTAVVLDPTLATKLSFSTPPKLTGMKPTTASTKGGDRVVLTGSFDGFNDEDRINVGGYVIYGAETSIDSASQITFSVPPLSSLGQSYTYEVTVAMCAEQSSPLKLSYVVSPSLTITAVDSNVDDTGSYIVPRDGILSFLAEVSGNNDGIEYVWKIHSSEGQELSTGETTTNSQVFAVSSSLLSSTTELYTVTCEVKNLLELTDSQSITAKLGEAGVSYLTVQVYNVEDLSRSVDAVTLVQSSVQYIADAASNETITESDIVLEWNYIGKKFKMDNSSAESDTTGPTQLGLEFNIARKDLVVGENELELVAYLSGNPDVRGSDEITINVIQSPLQPKVNNGVNGTLILEGTDLVLTAKSSLDPDVLEGEGDGTSGIEYQWFKCTKSLKSSFSFAENCTDILPNDKTSSDITISAASLSDARLDKSPDPNPTFFSFGLKIKKGDRIAQTFSFFQLRTVATSETIPELSSLHIVDVKGVPLQEVSIFSDVIIQPKSTDPSVQWAFDMSLTSQKYLFSKNGVLKSGEGFVRTRGAISRNLLGFAAGSLEPSTEYKVRVTASAADTSLVSDYDVSFVTADVPTLTCIPPEVTDGIISETKFIASAQLSFESQTIEYCFQLVRSPAKKYTVGKGCSPLPFAAFSFPIAGSYGIECLAKTSTGDLIANVTMPTKIVLSTRVPGPDSSTIAILSTQLAALRTQVDTCEALKDHACIKVLISSAPMFIDEVKAEVDGDTSEEAQLLLDGSKEYITRLSMLSESLAEKTVYRPNQIEDSIDQAFSMAQVPGGFVDSEATLFAYMAPVNNAVRSTTTDSAQPIIGNDIVEKVSGIANLTLATAFDITQEGTSRRRLRQNGDIIRHSFASVLNTATGLIGQIRAQQETCGYSGSESTSFPTSLGGSGRSTTVDGAVLPPVEVNVKVSCTRSQLTKGLQGSRVGLEFCETILGLTEVRRLVVTLVSIPDFAIEATGFLKNIESYVDELAYLRTQGVELTSIPLQCLQVVMKRKESTITANGYERLVGGLLDNLPTTSSAECTTGEGNPGECFAFDEEDDVTFGEKEVVIQTNREGMFIAGNFTARAPEPAPVSIEGVGLGAGGQILRAIGTGIAFIVGAVLVTWISASNFCIASAPEDQDSQTGAPVDRGWEYCERDLFGRERHLKERSKTSVPDVHLTIPQGARAPVDGPLSSN